METIRCFLGVKPDYDTALTLSEVQVDLRDRFNESGATVKWVPPPNLHVTIRFLGQLTEPMTYALKGMLRPILSNTGAFNMETVGLGVFPDPDKPKVIYAGIETGTNELTALHKKVSERLVEAGFNLNERPFSAHITLGRIKSGNGKPLDAFLEEHPNPSFGDAFIRNLYCYRSDLNPHGAEYHSMWRLPMQHRRITESNRRQPNNINRDPKIRSRGENPNDHDNDNKQESR